MYRGERSKEQAQLFARQKAHYHQSSPQRVLFWYKDSTKERIKKTKTSRNETDIFMSFEINCKYKFPQNVPRTPIYESISSSRSNCFWHPCRCHKQNHKFWIFCFIECLTAKNTVLPPNFLWKGTVMRKLCLSTKFPRQETRWNYVVFCSVWYH